MAKEQCKHEKTVNIPHKDKIHIMCKNVNCKKIIGTIPMPRKKN